MNSKWKTAIIWLAGIAIIAVIVMVGMKDSFVRLLSEDKTEVTEEEPIEVVRSAPEDAEEFYKERSTIVASYEAEKSEQMLSEGQAVENIHARGFEEYPVTYNYTKDGTYVEEQETSESNEQHPIYQTFYSSSSEELWTIMVVNGSIIATPISYNMQSDRGVRLIVSESEIIIGYDSSKNIFYETKPNESELIVHVVDHIDAETLDSLTMDVLGGLG